MKNHTKYQIDLTLADALCIVRSKRSPDSWVIFRPIHDIDTLEAEISERSDWDLFISKVVLLSRKEIECLIKLSNEDLNAEDWVVCECSKIFKFLEEWVCYITRNWPGDYREFIKGNE
ncbi:MAG: hypothetical protein OXF23_04780 [Candidatus Dadabacteria bacterium]|nr:hypothetical protein [Candidatus Dadabacteria bacterium]